jgi:hypothetical protein
MPRDLNTKEKISKLELRVQESKDDIVHMKQEIRNALFEISAMKDACRSQRPWSLRRWASLAFDMEVHIKVMVMEHRMESLLRCNDEEHN